jgi:hypothetical protein
MECQVEMATRLPEDVGRIIERHPRQAALVRQLILRNPDFRQLCEDYLLLTEMIAQADTGASEDSRETRKEYADLGAALELDISRALQRFGNDRAG